MKIFPHCFEEVFISKEISTDDVINNIIPPFDINDSEKKLSLLSTLYDYIHTLCPTGLLIVFSCACFIYLYY